jgi:L-rhamnose isomerase
MPHNRLKELQDTQSFTELLMLQEELKLYPVGDVWNELCARAGTIGDESWFNSVKDYEKNVLSNR